LQLPHWPGSTVFVGVLGQEHPVSGYGGEFACELQVSRQASFGHEGVHQDTDLVQRQFFGVHQMFVQGSLHLDRSASILGFLDAGLQPFRRIFKVHKV